MRTRKKSWEREGRGSPLHREKERGNVIIFRRHYFSLSRAEERCEKGRAGEGKELSLMRARMRGGESRRKFLPLTRACPRVQGDKREKRGSEIERERERDFLFSFSLFSLINFSSKK